VRDVVGFKVKAVVGISSAVVDFCPYVLVI
jgi:hypothetical protein